MSEPIERQEAEGDGLTGLQRRFVEEYCADFNATRAAERAGYQGDANTLAVTGHENLRKPKIAEAIEERLKVLSMTAGEATLRLTQWGRGSLHPFLRITADGEQVVDLSTAEAQTNLHLIRKIKQTETILSKDRKKTVLKVKTEIELYSAIDAVIQILKVHGKLIERHEVGLMAFVKGLSPSEAAELADLPAEELAKILPPGLLAR